MEKEDKKSADTKRVCPAKLDKFLYDNGIKDLTKMQHCCVSGTLRFGRTPRTAKAILVDNYGFENVEDPQLLPAVIVPLIEQKSRRPEGSDKNKEKEAKESVLVFLYGDATLDSLIAVCSEKWVDKVYGKATGKTTDHWL